MSLFDKSNEVATLTAAAFSSIADCVLTAAPNGITKPTTLAASPASLISFRLIYFFASSLTCVPILIWSTAVWNLSVKSSPNAELVIALALLTALLPKFLISPLNKDPNTVLASLPIPKALPVFFITFNSPANSAAADKADQAAASPLSAYLPSPMAFAISSLLGSLPRSSLNPVSIAL